MPSYAKCHHSNAAGQQPPEAAGYHFHPDLYRDGRAHAHPAATGTAASSSPARCAQNAVIRNSPSCRRSPQYHDEIPLQDIPTATSTTQKTAGSGLQSEEQGESPGAVRAQFTTSAAAHHSVSLSTSHINLAPPCSPSDAVAGPSTSAGGLPPSISSLHPFTTQLSPSHRSSVSSFPSTSYQSRSSPCLPSHVVHLTEPTTPSSPHPASPKVSGVNPPPPSPAVRLQEFFEDEKESLIAASHRLYARLSEWLGRKNQNRPTRLATEQHTKGVYGVWSEKEKQDLQAARRKFSLMARRIGGSLEEGRTLLAEESGYSSPNMSSQPTPTANRRLIPPALRRSLELYPHRHPARPRMSLPCDPLRGTIDGRFSAQAAEKRSRLIRERRVSQEDEPGFKFDPGRRRLSKPGSWSREESTGEESGFEEEEPVEVRVPPCVIEERRDSGSSGPTVQETSDHLAEWTIPWDQLRFVNLLRQGTTTNIYRGRWHGEVMIHTFDGSDATTGQNFERLVNDLALIRHENVVLFMGACVTPPQLAVVTGLRRGVSLYHYQHDPTRPPLPYSSRIAVAKQVAQAMSYLHSRGIVHGHLNSRNVFLEAKIKLSILDHSMVEEPSEGGAARMPRHLINYLPPEMVRRMDVSSSLVRIPVAATQSSDVYMFGALVYELFHGAPPFTDLHPHALIYNVGMGRRQSTAHLHCSTAIREILLQCWASNPRDRPDFPSLLKAVTQTLPLHRSHSTSEPERINRAGLHCSAGPSAT